jgi:hypothetical protein
MATLTISAAARLCHCDRRTLQRAIHAGRLHLDAQHCLSREELMATGYLIVETPQVAPQDLPYDPTKYVLGRLCRRGHAYGTTGKTLLRLPALQCRQCQAERARERRRAKREGTA